MSNRKIYTAFISSEFKSLQDERALVIDCLLNKRVMPISMEHFTVTSSGQFADIQEHIDDSDLFILLLGRYYGSCDENGVSWTEREYDYAKKQKKHMIAVICDELAEAKSRDYDTLSPSEKKQIEFSNKIQFARTVSEKLSLTTIISQGLESALPKCDGWERVESSVMDAETLEKWREEHQAFHLAGNWYHMHLSHSDEEYIRIGTITITQEFTPDRYTELHFSGTNFDIRSYDEATNTVKPDRMKTTKFSGNYKLEENGKITGIFSSKREFSNGKFNSQTIDHGERRGIHDFQIDAFGSQPTEEFSGEFHDEAPSPKMGRTFVFRSERERNDALMDMRGNIIKKKYGGAS